MIEEHYREHYKRILNYMRFHAGDEWAAEDVIQEAYTRAIKYYDSFDGANFPAWFNRILINTLKDYRKANREQSNYQEFEENEVEGIPCNRYNEKIVKEIFELINKKTPEQIEVLTLYFKYGYVAADISALTTYTSKAAQQMITRFKKELRERYKRE